MIGKLLGAVLMVMSAIAAPLEWMTDLEAAGKRAEAEGKLLLVEFTGSDWCRACLLQKKAVLSDAAFEAWAEQHCIAVEIDVPNDAARVGSEMQKILNRRICEEYGIYRFPTLRIMTADLVDVGGYSGALGSAAAAIGELEKAFPPAEQLEQALRKKPVRNAQPRSAPYTAPFHKKSGHGLSPCYSSLLRQTHKTPPECCRYMRSNNKSAEWSATCLPRSPRRSDSFV